MPSGLISKINWTMALLDAAATLLKDYEGWVSRTRACRTPIRSKGRKNDVERIFSRGQDGKRVRLLFLKSWRMCGVIAAERF